jgi:hypothetical protein
MKKHTILMASIYIVSLSINLIPSLKHPDSNLTLINLLTSLMLMIAIILWVKSVATSKKTRFLKIISAIGMISGIFVFSISQVQHITYEILILDIVSGIQYPLYLLFITPLFGINYILNTNYGVFSVIISLFYLATFLLCSFYQKKQK